MWAWVLLYYDRNRLHLDDILYRCQAESEAHKGRKLVDMVCKKGLQCTVHQRHMDELSH